MTPERESNMRAQLAELSPEKIIDTCVDMQTVIDGHVSAQTGYKSSINQMSRQIPALQARVEELEAAEGDTSQVNSEDYDDLVRKHDKLVVRCTELQELNEGLQRKLLE